MKKALVLINGYTGTEESLRDELKTHEEVEEAKLIYGVYDIIAVIKSKTDEGLRDYMSKLKKRDDVQSTLTSLIYFQDRRKGKKFERIFDNNSF